jgi:hypothetical protein
MIAKLVEDEITPKTTSLEHVGITLEDKMQRQMRWYYMNYHAQDVIVLGRIAMKELNYETIVEIGFPTLLNIYCTKGKNFDNIFVKGEYEKLGLDYLTASKVVTVFDDLRHRLPNDITEDEIGSTFITRSMPPCLCSKSGLFEAYREPFQSPEILVRAKRNIEDLTQLTNSTEKTLIDPATQHTRLSSISTQLLGHSEDKENIQSQESDDSDMSSLIIYGNSSKQRKLKK